MNKKLIENDYYLLQREFFAYKKSMRKHKKLRKDVEFIQGKYQLEGRKC